jgi:cytosine/adenosine deaminase-related metal-dependent hydrolase
MRRLSADYIFPIASEPIKNGVITVDADGTIVSVEKPADGVKAEYYKGIICPGFINTHCHLELSHMRSRIPEKLGMAGFIKSIVTERTRLSEEQLQDAIAAAEKEMIDNGIVAVGDISNNNSTFRQKAKGNILYHTFIEVFDLNPHKAQASFAAGLTLQQELSGLNLRSSIVPHAPYTVSENLLELIDAHAAKTKGIVSIHNQESKAESELFISHSGPIYEAFKAMGINTAVLRETGVNALKSTLPHLKNASNLLLVHNTYTTREDIKWAKEIMEKREGEMGNENISNLTSPISHLYWCTCPNANLYIENTLPDYNNFIAAKVLVTIGTDSLASNWSLSVLDELKTISTYYPDIPLQTLLLWATGNGAALLGLNHLGTLEKGKKPGLNLLTGIEEMKITKATKVTRLL